METTETKPVVKTEEPAPKPKVSSESKALTSAKQEFIKTLRTAAKQFKDTVDAELQKVEPGHPDYGNLKFAKIRAERVQFNADELSRGKVNR